MALTLIRIRVSDIEPRTRSKLKTVEYFVRFLIIVLPVDLSQAAEGKLLAPPEKLSARSTA